MAENPSVEQWQELHKELQTAQEFGRRMNDEAQRLQAELTKLKMELSSIHREWNVLSERFDRIDQP